MNYSVFIRSESDIGRNEERINKFLSQKSENDICYVFCEGESNSNELMKKFIRFYQTPDVFAMVAIDHIVMIRYLTPTTCEVITKDENGKNWQTHIVEATDEYLAQELDDITIYLNRKSSFES